MALHKDFPPSPHAILDPAIRWFPADEALRETTMDKLTPPLVPTLRRKVKEFRDGGYVGAAATSRSLLNWWFNTPHLVEEGDGAMAEFQYFFAQREAMETIVYLMDVVGVKDKHDLMRFDGSGLVSAGMFDESWRRFVVKMATGSGKTKVLSLALAWSFYHKLYEPASRMARNFLVIAPNIIVLDRIYKDFQGLRIFFQDPVVPDNGYEGRNWRDDFQLTLHLQDEVRVTHPTGNTFLTNIHRVYAGDGIAPSAEDENTMDYFLGPRPTGATTDSKVDLGMIVQTIADYPLLEAICQNVVKHPVLPDAPSRAKLSERQNSRYVERYADYLDLGVIEWRAARAEHEKMGKKAILFVMTDDTRNCDDVAAYLAGNFPDLKDAVLVIHTKNNGEISEASSGKAKEELEALRKQANEIDAPGSPYKAIVSVLMLKEGWDVRNVTTIVGLRAYASKSNILPEQTLGRGLRKMYPGGIEEYVSVVGTDAFMEFVESIQAEGVVLERRPMGPGNKPNAPLVVEIDEQNPEKNLDALDIAIPILSPRAYREYKNLADLKVEEGFQRVLYRQFSAEEQREIVFKDITTNEKTHVTILDTAGAADYRNVLGFFAQAVMKDLRLVSGYDVLFAKIKSFARDELFGQTVDLEDPNTLRNLSETAATKTLLEVFKRAVNALTVRDRGDAEIRDTIKLRQTRPFVVRDQPYVV